MQHVQCVVLYGLPLVYSCGILIASSCCANEASLECMWYLICVMYILGDEACCAFYLKDSYVTSVFYSIEHRNYPKFKNVQYQSLSNKGAIK